uniref:Uncharacterized protein n=1 Tax=Oryza rufipogon TaxID=4529 RepID=A0A0E0N1D3_ORYRU
MGDELSLALETGRVLEALAPRLGSGSGSGSARLAYGGEKSKAAGRLSWLPPPLLPGRRRAALRRPARPPPPATHTGVGKG